MRLRKGYLPKYHLKRSFQDQVRPMKSDLVKIAHASNTHFHVFNNAGGKNNEGKETKKNTHRDVFNITDYILSILTCRFKIKKSRM